jgi:type II secretory pathway pseudopilin PulG
MIIIGILISVVIPYYTTSVTASKVQTVENNMRAIGSREQKYSEDHNGTYYASANFGNICSNLNLSLASENDGFTYTCLASGVCTAASAGTTITVDNNGSLSCAGVCPP